MIDSDEKKELEISLDQPTQIPYMRSSRSGDSVDRSAVVYVAYAVCWQRSTSRSICQYRHSIKSS